MNKYGAIGEYYNAIISGSVTVGEDILTAYKILIDDLDNRRCFYNFHKAQKAIAFIENFCHHSKGRNDLFKLELWQKACISAIFGIVDPFGNRRFREVFLVIARKNGKSLLASGIALYLAYCDGEIGADIYCIAPKLDQAAIVYDGCYAMIKAEEELRPHAKKTREGIEIDFSGAIIRKIAFNEKKSDGYNPHGCICDEIASWNAAAGLKQYEVLKSALGARRQPLILSISTAGYIDNGIYDELMMRSTAFLYGEEDREYRFLPLIYKIDDEDKWNDIEELRKSNPNMGVSLPESYYRDEIIVAEKSLSKKNEFLCKYGNIKVNSSVAWLPASVVRKASELTFSIEDFRETYCVGGIDLSQTTDLTSCCVIIEQNKKLFTFSKFFMPANKIKELQEAEGVPYELFVQRGILTPSGDNYIDYEDCYKWFVGLVEDFEILPQMIGYDRYTAQYLIKDLQTYGFHTDDVFQGDNLTPVIRECEGLLRDGTLQLGQNPLLVSHFMNTAIVSNMMTRKCRISKIQSRKHIDGCAAVLDALTVRQKHSEQIGDRLRNEDNNE